MEIQGNIIVSDLSRICGSSTQLKHSVHLRELTQYFYRFIVKILGPFQSYTIQKEKPINNSCKVKMFVPFMIHFVYILMFPMTMSTRTREFEQQNSAAHRSLVCFAIFETNVCTLIFMFVVHTHTHVAIGNDVGSSCALVLIGKYSIQDDQRRRHKIHQQFHGHMGRNPYPITQKPSSHRVPSTRVVVVW